MLICLISLLFSVYGLVGKPDSCVGGVTIVPATYLELKRKELTKEAPLRCHSVAATTEPATTSRTTIANGISRERSFIQYNQSQPTSPITASHQDESRSVYANQSQRSSMLSLADTDLVHHGPRFYRDTTHLWYKPNMSRDEAIRVLKIRPAGSFLVRDSQSFPGSFGLMLRVAELTPEMTRKSADPTDDLIRHFLIEPTSKGVRIKGCANEPVFGSLSALIYQHSCTQLALPCKLLLPETTDSPAHQTLQRLYSAPPSPAFSTGSNLSTPPIMLDGAGCNVLYLITVDTESLTGPQAIKKAVEEFLEQSQAHQRSVLNSLAQAQDSKNRESKSKDKESKNKFKAKDADLVSQQQQTVANQSPLNRSNSMGSNASRVTVVYFKVSPKGITLTDNTHR